MASRWEGVRLPRASGKSPDFPGSSPNFPRSFFGDFPGSSLTVELNSNPEVPRKFPKPPRKFPKLPRKFPDFPGGQPLSLGSLTPSLRCCFPPPSGRNRQGHFQSILVNFSRLFTHFQSILVSFQSISVNFSQF